MPAVSLTHGSVHQRWGFLPSPALCFPSVSTSLLSVSVAPFPSCTYVHQCHFSRFCIYVLTVLLGYVSDTHTDTHTLWFSPSTHALRLLELHPAPMSQHCLDLLLARQRPGMKAQPPHHLLGQTNALYTPELPAASLPGFPAPTLTLLSSSSSLRNPWHLSVHLSGYLGGPRDRKGCQAGRAQRGSHLRDIWNPRSPPPLRVQMLTASSIRPTA